MTIRRDGHRPYVPVVLARADDKAWRARVKKRIAADVAWVEKQMRVEQRFRAVLARPGVMEERK